MIYLAILLCVISLVLCVRCLRVRRQRKSPEWEKSLTISFFFGAVGFFVLPILLGMSAFQLAADWISRFCQRPDFCCPSYHICVRKKEKSTRNSSAVFFPSI